MKIDELQRAVRLLASYQAAAGADPAAVLETVGR